MPAPEPDYYEIIAKAHDNDNHILVIGAKADSTEVVVQSKLDWEHADKDLQLWERRPRPQGGYVLVNKRHGSCITRESNNNGTWLVLADTGAANVNDLSAWRDDGNEGTYMAINSFADWEQKINIPGNGPYNPNSRLISWQWDGGDPNELWNFQNSVAKVELKEIVFDMDKATLSDQTPMVAGSQTVLNTTSSEQEQKVTFRFLESHRFTFNYERGFKLTGSIETTAKIPLVGEAKVKIQVETHFKWSSESETSEEREVTIEVPVKVPPFSAVEVEVLLLNARLDVPYRAELMVTHWDGNPVATSAWGMFNGVNAYNVISRYKESPLASRRVTSATTSLSRMR
ncbi:MAG: ETX/MTX2 family pore-forming toxin [Polyangiaceae bacterium]